jgi:putative tryptophan/tyrosine transport system substrate-binding protein
VQDAVAASRPPHHPNMDRRRFLLTSLAGSLAAPLAGEAQKAPKLPRIGTLSAFSRAETEGSPFWGAMRELGWIEGQNIMVERRWAEGRLDRLSALATELVQLKVDLILANAGAEIFAAKRATKTIPIVMGSSLDAVEQGFVASLSRPGANVTGVTSMTSELSRKRLELLKETVPKTVRIAILSCKGPGLTPLPGLTGTLAAARAIGVSPQLLEVREADDYEAAFAAAIRERAEATVVFTCYSNVLNAPRIAALAARHRLPTMYNERWWVDAGGLMSYGPRLPDMARLVAIYVDKILKGAKPADLPVEQPTKFEFVINLKTAKALGLTIPPSLLARADQVVE